MQRPINCALNENDYRLAIKICNIDPEVLTLNIGIIFE